MSSFSSTSPLKEGVLRVLFLSLSSSHTHSPRPHRLISQTSFPGVDFPPAPDPWMQVPTGHLHAVTSDSARLSPTHHLHQPLPNPVSLTGPPAPLSPPHTPRFSLRAPSCTTWLPTAACRLTPSLAHREAKVMSPLGPITQGNPGLGIRR